MKFGSSSVGNLRLGSAQATRAYLGSALAWDAILALQPALWLDASDASTLYDSTSGGSLVAPNGAVARWEDKSGYGRHATINYSPWRPTLTAGGGINSRPSLGFNGATGSVMYVPDSGVSSRLDFTIIVVHKFASVSGIWKMLAGHIIAANEITGVGAAGNVLVQQRKGTTQIGCHNAGVADAGVFVDSGAGFTSPRVTILRRSGATAGNLGNGSTITVQSNNLSASGTQNWNTNANTNRFQIGGEQQAEVDFFGGEIAEVVLCGNALTDVQLDQTMFLLKNKWGIA